MKYDNQLRNAVNIIETFNGKSPLHNWLKDFFRQNKQMGSRDRKQMAEMVYCYYRLGHSSKKIAISERILAGLFLCNNTSNEILKYFKPEWNEQIELTSEQKLNIVSNHLGSSTSSFIESIFPWQDQLSPGIEPLSFSASFLQQPDLFIRLRPGFENMVKKKLYQHAISYREINSSCLAFANSTRLDELLDLDREAAVQDLSSQKAGSYFPAFETGLSTEKIKCWDCCAGSGGKTIMLYDQYPEADITVSDIRESILANLKKRFQNAGISGYKAFIADLANPTTKIPVAKNSIDMIVADVPCSGSGTWARNPDALYYFGLPDAERYQALQKKILSNAIPYIKKGGCLLYITCSVFKKENEEVADFIQQDFSLHLERKNILTGYDQRADSMFVAQFSV